MIDQCDACGRRTDDVTITPAGRLCVDRVACGLARVHEVQEAIERARRIVEAMPTWKRGILEASGKPNCSTPRSPVDNSGEGHGPG